MFKKIKPQFFAYTAWLIAIGATLGSLALSTVWHYAPCDLCWFQRIFMYPLPLVIGVGIWLKDKRLAFYVWPLVAIGSLIALYHTFLQWGWIEAITQCSLQAPCTTKYINWLGFITIPLMSLLAFKAIGLAMWFYHKANKG